MSPVDLVKNAISMLVMWMRLRRSMLMLSIIR